MRARLGLVGCLLISATVATMAAATTPAYAVRPGCTPAPTRAPWLPGTDAGAPAPVPFLSVHRGGTNLAPQQTAAAFESALAFGADLIEVDLHVLIDGAIVAFHDDTVPDGRFVGDLTTAEFKALNAAGSGRFAGSAFDPSSYLLFDEAVAIARAGGPRAGLDIEFKDLNVRANQGGASLRGPYTAVAQQVKDAGLMDTSLFQYNGSQPNLIPEVKAVDPDARFNFNITELDTPAKLYQQASTNDFSYGSDLAKFTPEILAAIHDGCAIAVPHSYDEGADEEGNQIVAGRARGVDGFQTNQADVAADALDRPVPSQWRRDPADPARACLVNPINGYGLLERTITLDDGTTTTVGPGGCVDAGSRLASFAGDGAALASAEGGGPAPVVPEVPLPALGVAAMLLVGALTVRRRVVAAAR